MILKEFHSPATKSLAFVLDKPAGVSTHTPDAGVTPGFVEMAEGLLQCKLWAIHRLDHSTSGCLLVTTTAEAVEEWSQKLTTGKKKYIFISKQESKQALWSFAGRIEKLAPHQFGLVDGEANSKTTFAKLRECDLGYLYEAEISSGKTHQIRIHAKASGVPILGDETYGGEAFSRVMLHAKELELAGENILSPPPMLFSLSGGKSHEFIRFMTSFDRRRFFMDFSKGTNSFRLVHREWKSLKGTAFSFEKLNNVLQILQYLGRPMDQEFAAQYAKLSGCSDFLVRQMQDRGKLRTERPLPLLSDGFPEKWLVKENEMSFELRPNQGLSSGLFLDQRTNRERVRKTSRGKCVANFFSYTCGFSVAAALGGAQEVVSVDTSASSLDWGKENFRHNGLDPEKFEFFVADAIFFLNSCVKRKRFFDIVILDPPTFSRSKKGVFKFKEDLKKLLCLTLQCLDQKGEFLLTTNDETISSPELKRSIEEVTGGLILEAVTPPWDFEFPLEREKVMKGFWVKR